MGGYLSMQLVPGRQGDSNDSLPSLISFELLARRVYAPRRLVLYDAPVDVVTFSRLKFHYLRPLGSWPGYRIMKMAPRDWAKI